MKIFKNIILFICASSIIPVKAQIFLITYDQITNFGSQPDTTVGSLVVDAEKGVSLYEFGKVSIQKSASRSIDQEGNMIVRAPKKVDTIGSYIRTDLTTGHQELREKVLGTYFLVNDTTKILWSVARDTSINEKNLKTATCTFRGRDYTVNFIPLEGISVGPWKFRGLPGLIVEVLDRTNEVGFKLREIDRSSGNMLIEPTKIPGMSHFLTYETFRKHRNNLRDQDVASLGTTSGSGRLTKVIYSQINVNYLEKD
ncbi:exported hypothetical protein [Sphingobacterium sp. PM2-P1-29]|nr:exported hypothetical protein [Sphingobacterium sp. PM2-P1-29]